MAVKHTPSGLLILFLLFFASSEFAEAQAQDEPCVPDCEQTQWSTVTKTMTMTIPNDGTIPGYSGGCVVNITYVTRLACGIHQDFQITGMTVTVSNACGSVFQWLVGQHNQTNRTALNTWTQDMYKLVEKEIAKKEFMTWYGGLTQTQQAQYVCGVGANTQWRAVRASCVVWQLDGCCWEVVSCPEVGCCLKSFSICYDNMTGEPNVTATGGTYVSEPCGEAPPDIGTVSGELCIPVCDDDSGE